MADEPGASSGGGSTRKVAFVAGLGLIAVGAYQLTKGAPKPGGATGTGSGSGSGTTPGKRVALATWLGACRADIVQAVQQGSWGSVLGQYLREQWPDFVNRSDIGGNISNDALGQWLREVAPSFWNRPDIQAAWFSGAAVAAIGQFLKEAGALNCAGATVLAPTGSGAGSGTTAAGGGILPISNVNALVPGYIVSTGCRWSDADYVVISQVGGGGLARIWIQDYPTWQRLGAPRSAIRLITASVLFALPDRGTLRWTGSTWVWSRNPPGWGVLGGPSVPPNIVTTSAGYCT